MLRRLAAIALMICCCVLLSAQPGDARARDRRIVVVLVEQARIGEWQHIPVLQAMLDQGSSALLSTRGPSASRASSLRALGAGARTDDGGALARALVPDGVPYVVSRALQRTFGAGIARDIVPGDLQTPSVAILEAGADPAPMLRRVGEVLTAQDLLIVLSPYDRSGTTFLGVIAARTARGTLFSPSTRRTDLVTIEDVAPTILHELAIPIPSSMTGRPVEIHTDQGSLVPLERDLLHAAAARPLLVHVFMYFAIVVAAFGGVQIVRGRTTGIAHASAVVACAIPLMLLVEPVYGARMRPGIALACVLASAVVVAVLARAVGRPAGVIGAVSALAVLIDVTAGAPLASRSPLSYLLARGDRFYGIGNELMGVVIGGALLAICAWPPRDRRMTIAYAVAALVVVSVLIAPAAGAKFGAPFTAVPALGYVFARGAGWRPGWKLAAMLAGATLAIAAVAFAADRAVSSSARSHIGSIGTGSGTFARKLGAALSLFRFSIWFDAMLVFAVLVVLIARRRRYVLRAPILQAAGIALVCAIAFNDAGLIAAAIIGTMMLPIVLRDGRDGGDGIAPAG